MPLMPPLLAMLTLPVRAALLRALRKPNNSCEPTWLKRALTLPQCVASARERPSLDLAKITVDAFAVDLAGNLVWRSASIRCRDQGPADASVVAGRGWLEFVDTRDCARALAWVLDPATHANHIFYRVMDQHTGHGRQYCARKIAMPDEFWLILLVDVGPARLSRLRR